MSNKDGTKKLLQIEHRKLQKLKEQQAKLGVFAPHHILIDIEDTEAKIENLQTELEALDFSNGYLKNQPYYNDEVQQPSLEKNPIVVIGKKKFYLRDRVRIRTWAGTIKPEETDLPDVSATKGHSGIVVGGKESTLRIQWDEQEWMKPLYPKSVKLRSFISNIEAHWLDIIE